MICLKPPFCSVPQWRLAGSLAIGLAFACSPSGGGKETDSVAAGLSGEANDALAPVAQTPNVATVPATGPASTPNAVAIAANATIEATKAIAWPYVGFDNEMLGNDNKVIALSFDDGPDGIGLAQGRAGYSNTSYMLDQLDALKLKATFFLCGNRTTDVLNDPKAIAEAKRIVASGHAIGNHTYRHDKWDANITLPQLQEAITANEKTYQDPRLFGPGFSFTMWRAPLGIPFQDGLVYPPEAAAVAASIDRVASYSPPNAVHVGWGIDSKDWLCAGDPATATSTAADQNCVMANVNLFLQGGASGVMLMHSIYRLSGDVLPRIVQAATAKGYRFVQVEDFIKAKYGVTSASIAAANRATTFSAPTLSAAAFAATQTSKWYRQTNEN